jgi:predicted unusual protein kinase regulating ubiquinone biosynthesis (AarF/ABC1/UbiB family)
VRGDLKLVKFATKCAIKLFPDFKYKWLSDEFEKGVPKEIDFIQESKNCERCSDMFKGNPNVAVPRVYKK